MLAAHDPNAYARAASFLAEWADNPRDPEYHPRQGDDGYYGLGAMAQDAELLGCFAEMFPREFARLGPEALLRSGETRLGAKQLAELVSRRLFPINEEIFDDEYGVFRGIPYIPFLYSEEWHELEALPSSLQLGVYLLGDERGQVLDEDGYPYGDECGDRNPLDSLGLTLEQCARVPGPLCGVQVVADVATELARVPRPLRGVVTCVRLAARASDNIFFDGCECCGTHDHEIDWTAWNLRYLKDQFDEAKKLSGDIRGLSRWLDRDRPARVVRAVEVWNRAVIVARARRGNGKA